MILRGVRWYVAYPISYRQLEEMMEEHRVEVHYSTLNRWWSAPGLFSSQQIQRIFRTSLRSIALRHLAFLMFWQPSARSRL